MTVARIHFLLSGVLDSPVPDGFASMSPEEQAREAARILEDASDARILDAIRTAEHGLLDQSPEPAAAETESGIPIFTTPAYAAYVAPNAFAPKREDP